MRTWHLDNEGRLHAALQGDDEEEVRARLQAAGGISDYHPWTWLDYADDLAQGKALVNLGVQRSQENPRRRHVQLLIESQRV